eukprot:3944221-Pleurochrysis_carterae.AAC.2
MLFEVVRSTSIDFHTLSVAVERQSESKGASGAALSASSADSASALRRARSADSIASRCGISGVSVRPARRIASATAVSTTSLFSLPITTIAAGEYCSSANSIEPTTRSSFWQTLPHTRSECREPVCVSKMSSTGAYERAQETTTASTAVGARGFSFSAATPSVDKREFAT